MQISPDTNVRVEQTNLAGGIPVSSQNAAGLQDGDFLVVRVEQIHEGTLSLRTDDGFLLKAEIQGQMSFSEGDVIEAAVNKGDEGCLLYVLNVLHEGGTETKDTAPISLQTLSAMLAVIKRNPGLDTEIALFLAANNIPDTAENIAALTQMSQGTGIGALLGQILGMMVPPDETVQPGSPALPDAMPAGDAALSPQGESLPAAADIVPEGVKAQLMPRAMPQGQTVPDGTSGTQRGAVPVQVSETGEQAGVNSQQSDPMIANTTQIDPQQGPALPVQTMGPGMEPDMSGSQTGQITQNVQTEVPSPTQNTGVSVPGPLPDASNMADSQAAPQQNTVNTDVHDRAQTIGSQPPVEREMSESNRAGSILTGPMIPENTAARADGTDAGTTRGLDENIGKLIRGLFFLPEEQPGVEMKKTADDVSRTLKTLKSELIQTDIKYKELCLKSADQALRQLEMSDRAAHFEHMQIPFAVKEGEHRTAELYVFQRNGGQKEAADAGLSILVALDTEHVGRVETMLRESGGSISLEFRLEQPDVAEMFKRHSISLQETVEAAGFTLTGMRFAGLEKRTTVLNAGEMISLNAGEMPPGIDVQI